MHDIIARHQIHEPAEYHPQSWGRCTTRVRFSTHVPIGIGHLADMEGEAIINGSAMEGWDYLGIELETFIHVSRFDNRWGLVELTGDPLAEAMHDAIIKALGTDEDHARACADALDQAERDERIAAAEQRADERSGR